MTSTTELPEWAILGVTAEDYEELPEDPCRRIEIVDGAVVFQPNPGRQHQHVVGGLTTTLHKACDPGRAGIEHFWRAEIDDEERLTVFRYRLSPMTKTYAPARAHTDKLVVTDPLRVSIDLGELL